RKMVDVSLIAARLLDEDRRLTERHAAGRRSRGVRGPRVEAQSAGDQLGMQATRAAAGTLTGLRGAIDFPTFVNSLITGVFQAILTSSTQQVGALGEMLDHLAASAEEFEGTLSDAEVAQYAVGKLRFLVADGSAEGGVSLRPGTDLDVVRPQIKSML